MSTFYYDYFDFNKKKNLDYDQRLIKNEIDELRTENKFMNKNINISENKLE